MFGFYFNDCYLVFQNTDRFSSPNGNDFNTQVGYLAEPSKSQLHFGVVTTYSRIKALLTEEDKATFSTTSPDQIVYISSHVTSLELEPTRTCLLWEKRAQLFLLQNEYYGKEPHRRIKQCVDINQQNLASELVPGGYIPFENINKFGDFYDFIEKQSIKLDERRNTSREKLNKLKDNLKYKRSAADIMTLLQEERESIKTWIHSLRDVNDLLNGQKIETQLICFNQLLPFFYWDHMMASEDEMGLFFSIAVDAVGCSVAIDYLTHFWPKTDHGLPRFFNYHIREDLIHTEVNTPELIAQYYLSLLPFLSHLLDSEKIKFKAMNFIDDREKGNNKTERVRDKQKTLSVINQHVADDIRMFIRNLGYLQPLILQQVEQALREQLPKCMTNYEQFEYFMEYSYGYKIGQHIVFQTVEDMLPSMIERETRKDVDFLRPLMLLQDPNDRMRYLGKCKSHLTSEKLNSYISSSFLNATENRQLTLLVNLLDYKAQREAKHAEYFYYGLFKWTGAFSRRQKLAAVEALIEVVLDPIGCELDLHHLPALRQGNLGKTIKSFLQEQGTENESIGDFLKEIQTKYQGMYKRHSI